MFAKAMTVAGSDSGGGAGIQADLKTFHNLGVYGMSAITALTAQNTRGVHGICGIDPDFVAAQIRACLDDIGADAMKTGMLFNADIINAVADTLPGYRGIPLIIDPVMVAKSGHRLLREDACRALCEKLFPMALLVTPNLDEAADITGIIPESEKDMPRIANRILEMGPKWVLVKGGHLSGSAAVDYLTDGKEAVRLEHARLDAQHTHGTGCTLSAAITAYIARGEAVIPAVSKAKDYVTRGIRAGVAIGGGISPINHLSRDLREHP